jgi:hypothetical protein
LALNISSPPAITFSQSGNLPATCHNIANGSASFFISGGTSPYSITLGGHVSTNNTISNLYPGIYTAQATDSKGCTKVDSVTIGGPPRLYADTTSTIQPTCFGESNGTVSIAGFGGSGTYNFEWLNTPAPSNSYSVSGLLAGFYHIKITDANLCTDTSTVQLFEPDPLNIPLGDTIVNCYNYIAALDAGTEGTVYQWIFPNDSVSTQQLIHTALEGDYSVTVTNAKGCSATKSIFLDNKDRTVEAIFLVSSEASLSDTIVLIEVSWPVPEAVEWKIPENFNIITDLGFYKELIPKDTGVYTIEMSATVNGCPNRMVKSITIFPDDSSNTKATRAGELITGIRLYPNPNTGSFKLEVELSREAGIKVDLFSQRGLRISAPNYAYNSRFHQMDYKLGKMVPGIYFMTVVAEDQVKRVKFVVE